MRDVTRLDALCDFVDALAAREKYYASGMAFMVLLSAAFHRFLEGSVVYGANGFAISFSIFLLSGYFFGMAVTFALSIKARMQYSKIENSYPVEYDGPYEYSHAVFAWLSSALIWLVFVVDPKLRDYISDPLEINSAIARIHNRGFILASFGVVIFIGQVIFELWGVTLEDLGSGGTS